MFTGVEKTRWAHEAKYEQEPKSEKRAFGRNVFLESRQVLRRFEDNYIPMGYYSFPFRFKLPEWVPSSMVYSGSKAKKLSILYTLKVTMEDI